MVTGRIDDPCRHTRAEDSAFRHSDFYKVQNCSEDTCPNRQQSSFELLGEMGQPKP